MKNMYNEMPQRGQNDCFHSLDSFVHARHRCHFQNLYCVNEADLCASYEVKSSFTQNIFEPLLLLTRFIFIVSVTIPAIPISITVVISTIAAFVHFEIVEHHAFDCNASLL